MQASLEHPLFVALTRPPILLGVTLDYLACSVLIVLCHFLLINQLWVLCFYIPLHLIGWVACNIDHHLFRLWSKQCYVRQRTGGGAFMGGQTYAPF